MKPTGAKVKSVAAVNDLFTAFGASFRGGAFVLWGWAMGLGAIANLAVRAELCDRIDAIARELPHLSASKLAFAVDDIRRTARANGLDPLAELARSLEHAIADSGGSTVVLSFLEAMGDAAGCERVDSATAQSYLASVGLRLHG